MSIQYAIIAVSVIIALVLAFNWLSKKTVARYEKTKKQYYDDLKTKPFFNFNITTAALRHASSVVYLNNFKPLRVIFNDLKGGDFSETQYLMIRDDGAAAYNTNTAALAAYKPAIHLGLVEITADKAGRLELRSIPLPDYKDNVVVELGYSAYKELVAPDFIKLTREYKG